MVRLRRRSSPPARFPRETIALARGVPNARYVQGNADREMIDGRRGSDHRLGLDAGRPRTTSDVPRVVRADASRSTTSSTATRRRTTTSRSITVLTPDDVAARDDRRGRPPDGRRSATRTRSSTGSSAISALVNAGSVGMPLRGRAGRLLGCSSATASPSTGAPTTTSRRPPSGSAPTGWPIAEQWVNENLLTVPTARDAAEFFEQQRSRR